MSEHECPNPHCGNSGAYPVEPDGDAEQCEWCHTVPESVFNLKGRIAQLERELAEAVSKVDVAEVLRDHLLGRELSLEDAFKRRLGIDLMYHLKKQKGADE